MKRRRILWFYTILWMLGVAGFIGYSFKSSSNTKNAALLVLSLPDNVEEQLVFERLDKLNLSPVVSESTQFVYIDDFEKPRSIPLKEFDKYIEPLDPRNDGYVDKLKNVFVSGGQRRFFIPLSFYSPWTRMDTLIRKIEKSLSEYGPTIQVSGSNQVQLPWWLNGLVFAGILIYFALISRRKTHIVTALPTMLVFLNAGFGGLVAAGLLIAMKTALEQSMQDFMFRLYKKEPVHVPAFFHWYKTDLINGLIFLILYVLSCFVLTIPWTIALAGLVVLISTDTLFSLLYFESASKIEHRFFLPIQLIRSVKSFAEPLRVLLPFVSCAAAFFVLSILIQGSKSVSGKTDANLIPLSFDNYQAHMERQYRFSIDSLYPDSSNNGGYYTYVLDADGLISAKTHEVAIDNVYQTLSLPPLESLLLSGNAPIIRSHSIGQGLYLVIFISGILFILFRASHGQLLALYKSGYLDKRIAA